MLHLDDAAALERRSVPLEVERCSLPQGESVDIRTTRS